MIQLKTLRAKLWNCLLFQQMSTYDHEKPREATAIALDTKYKERYEHVKVTRPKYQPPEPPMKISA